MPFFTGKLSSLYLMNRIQSKRLWLDSNGFPMGSQRVSKLPIAAVFETGLKDNTGKSVVKNGKNFNFHTFSIFSWKIKFSKNRKFLRFETKRIVFKPFNSAIFAQINLVFQASFSDKFSQNLILSHVQTVHYLFLTVSLFIILRQIKKERNSV